MSVIDPTRASDPDALTPEELEPAEADPTPDDPVAKLMAKIEEFRKTDPAPAERQG